MSESGYMLNLLAGILAQKCGGCLQFIKLGPRHVAYIQTENRGGKLYTHSRGVSPN